MKLPEEGYKVWYILQALYEHFTCRKCKKCFFYQTVITGCDKNVITIDSFDKDTDGSDILNLAM